VLVSLAGVASIFFGLGKNSRAYCFFGILHTVMMALASPFMKYSSAQNKIMMLALIFSYGLCYFRSLNECMWVSTVQLHLSGGSPYWNLSVYVDIMVVAGGIYLHV
jgi:hypothetical protein